MKSTSPPLNNYQWKTSQLFKAQAWTSADNNPNKFRTNEYKPMESTTKYRSSSSLIHSKPPSLGATGKRNLISVLYLQHGANGKGGIELFPMRLFRWMIRVKSSIITHSYSLPVTVNFENVPQFRTPHPYAKAWFQSYGEKVMASNTGWGTGDGKDDGMTSFLSKYWVLRILWRRHYPCKSTRSAEDAEQIWCCDRRRTAFLSDSSFAKLWKLSDCENYVRDR